MIISFALGNIWRWSSSVNRGTLIKHVRKLDVDGVELTFASKEALYNFKLSPSSIIWLKSLKYVSLHAPFKLVSKAQDDKEVKKQLDLLAGLYDKVKAKNVIIHPTELPEVRVLDKYPMIISTENMPVWRHVSIDGFKKLFARYPRLKLCLDVSHAYRVSPTETQQLIDNFRPKISQIHFSSTYRRADHQTLLRTTPGFLSSVSGIKSLRVPVVIEEDIETQSLKFVKEEVNRIKRLFL